MRIITLFVAITLMIVVAPGCCKKHNLDAAAILSPSSYMMAATITKSEGVTNFSAISSQYVTAVKSDSTCVITGNDTSGTSVVSNFTFKIVGFDGVGNYYVDSATLNHADYETNGIIYTQTSFAQGTITINGVIGENIYGTFEGTLTDGSVVANGKFIALGKGF